MPRNPCGTMAAALAACLLVLQSAGLSLLTARAAASCCCAHHEAHCHCKLCEHARELASGQPCLKSCGESSQGTAAIVHLDPVVPPAALLATPSRRPARVESRGATPPLNPPLDVPTPPPLAA